MYIFTKVCEGDSLAAAAPCACAPPSVALSLCANAVDLLHWDINIAAYVSF